MKYIKRKCNVYKFSKHTYTHTSCYSRAHEETHLSVLHLKSISNIHTHIRFFFPPATQSVRALEIEMFRNEMRLQVKKKCWCRICENINVSDTHVHARFTYFINKYVSYHLLSYTAQCARYMRNWSSNKIAF